MDQKIRTEKFNMTPDRTIYPKLGRAGYTVAEALAELIDNSIDARDGVVRVGIEMKMGKNGFIKIEDDGAGMNKEKAKNSIILGSSKKKEGELGQFGLGLKTACMSLGGKFIIETSIKNSDEEYSLVFDENEFIKSGDWNDFEIKIKNGIDKGKSFTRIIIENLRIRDYPNIFDVIRKHLSERFSPFIDNKEVILIFNKELIKSHPIEIFPDSKKKFTILIGNNQKIIGWTGILKVGSVERSGFNLYRYNRLIRAHEKLGYTYHPSKMAIVGEIHMDPVPVTHDKRGFITEDKLYIEFFKKFSEILKPILTEAQKRHGEDKIKDLPRELKETLKDNLLKALNRTDDFKELAFPGEKIQKRSKDDKGSLLDQESRDKNEPIGVVQTKEEVDGKKNRSPKKTKENKARFITIAGKRYSFDYNWGVLDEFIAKQAYLDKEKNTIFVILNSQYHIIKILPKVDLFYHIVYLTEGIAEVFLIENKQPLDKLINLRDKLTQQLADVMSEDIEDKFENKENQVLEAQSYLLNGSSKLTEKEKQVLHKRLIEGKKYKKIAQEIELSQLRAIQLFQSAMRKINNVDINVSNKENENKATKQDIEKIIKDTALMYNVPVEKVLGECRKKELVLPRQTIMYLLREQLRLSFNEIAKIMNKKDHTTILYAVEKMKKQINMKNK